MIRHLVATSIGIGALLPCSSLRAEVPAPVVVDYAAPPECPPATVFQHDVQSRLPEGRTVALGAIPSGVELGLQVRVVKVASGYRAELTTITVEGRSSPRHLEAPVCGELMDAMAFTAALTVDPNASATPAPEPTPTEPVSSGEFSPETAPTTPPTTSGGAPATNPPPIEPTVAPTFPEPPKPPHVPDWAASVSAGFALTSLVGPGVSPGLFAGLRYSDEAPGRWSPAVGFSLLGSQLVSSDVSNASFAAIGAQLDFCPSSLRDGSLTLRPCVIGQLALLRAEGKHLTNTDQVTVALPSVGAQLELQQAVSSRWFVTGVVGLQFILSRHSFATGLPAVEVAATRDLAPFGSLRLGAFL